MARARIPFKIGQMAVAFGFLEFLRDLLGKNQVTVNDGIVELELFN